MVLGETSTKTAAQTGQRGAEMFAARDFGSEHFAKKGLYPTNRPQWGARTSLGGPLVAEDSALPPQWLLEKPSDAKHKYDWLRVGSISWRQVVKSTQWPRAYHLHTVVSRQNKKRCTSRLMEAISAPSLPEGTRNGIETSQAMPYKNFTCNLLYVDRSPLQYAVILFSLVELTASSSVSGQPAHTTLRT